MPALLLVVLRLVPFAALLMVTAAFATTAPVGSVTVPVSVPRLVWANPGIASARASARTTHVLLVRRKSRSISPPKLCFTWGNTYELQLSSLGSKVPARKSFIPQWRLLTPWITFSSLFLYLKCIYENLHFSR